MRELRALVVGDGRVSWLDCFGELCKVMMDFFLGGRRGNMGLYRCRMLEGHAPKLLHVIMTMVGTCNS